MTPGLEYACAPAGLSPQQLLQIGGGVAVPSAPQVWLMPGAAFGAQALLPHGAGWLRLEGAAGAATLQSAEADEALALELLCRRHGRLAVDQVLCAAGVVELHAAVCALRGLRPRRIGMARIVAGAVDASSAECSRTMSIFCGLLGDVAGRAALMLGARGGVFVGGPVLALLGPWLARSPLRRRFEACAAAPQALRTIPTFLAYAGLAAGAARSVREQDEKGLLGTVH